MKGTLVKEARSTPFKLSPRNQDTQCCTDNSPYPGAGCNDSTAATAFAQISNQPSDSGSHQRTENIPRHSFNLSLIQDNSQEMKIITD
jgi:hypothetical protein